MLARSKCGGKEGGGKKGKEKRGERGRKGGLSPVLRGIIGHDSVNAKASEQTKHYQTRHYFPSIRTEEWPVKALSSIRNFLYG